MKEEVEILEKDSYSYYNVNVNFRGSLKHVFGRFIRGDKAIKDK